MISIQIQITEEQDRRLRALARKNGVSLAEMIRRCLDAIVELGLFFVRYRADARPIR